MSQPTPTSGQRPPPIDWTAPTQPVTDHPERPFTWRRCRQVMLWPYLGALVFLVFSVLAAAELTDPLRRWSAYLNLATLAVLFLLANPAVDAPVRWRALLCASFPAVMLAGWPLLGLDCLHNAVYPATMVAFLLPSRVAVPASIAWGAAVTGLGAADGSPAVQLIGAFAAGTGAMLSLALRVARSERLLARARLELEQAIVAGERARIGRDLHDVLGRSLTAVAIRADLAERLLRVDPAGAAREITQIQAVTRQALDDVRATASGLQEVTLEGEIAAARTVLAAAGVELVTSGQVPELDPDASALLGAVVREAVTNVARHARATRCTIELDVDSVRVRDDGVGRASADGGGLRGLTTRVQAAGGTLRIGPGGGAGTLVQARLTDREVGLRPSEQLQRLAGKHA